MLVTLIVVEALVCAVSAAPVVAGWMAISALTPARGAARWAVVSLAIVPSYVAFALCLIAVSPLTIRLLRWHSPPDGEMPIAGLEWPLLRWVRYLAALHLPRIIGGTLFRGTPLWTAHLRLNGARMGRGVYVNSLSISDYNLIECGDNVVIGGGVQLSGHTVESGIVKTARIRLGNNVTIGVGSVVEIGAEIGDDAQVGALSFVPKHAVLPAGGVYAGAPATRIE